MDSYEDLSRHLIVCRTQHHIGSKYVCKICCYHDDNSKVVENHVAVHDFILASCTAMCRMYDPSDYVEINGDAGFTRQVSVRCQKLIINLLTLSLEYRI